jgi:hypothetical protein
LAFALYLFEVPALPRLCPNLEEVKRESSGQSPALPRLCQNLEEVKREG